MMFILYWANGLNFKSRTQHRPQEKDNHYLQAMFWLVNFVYIYFGIQKDKLDKYGCAAVLEQQQHLKGWGREGGVEYCIPVVINIFLTVLLWASFGQ